MDFLNDIKEDTILIIPNNLKEKILKYIDSLDKLIPIKIFSLEELKKKIYFDYDTNAILYLMDKYHYKYEVSKVLLDNMYYVSDERYSSNKLNHLVTLKQELKSSSLLKEDPLFFDFINNKKIIVYGYDYLDKFNHNLLSKFNNVTVIDKYHDYQKELHVFSLDTIFDEVNFILDKISHLLENKVDINKIKITNIDSSYYHAFLTLSRLYNIPIKVTMDESIFSTMCCTKFIDILDNSTTLEEVIEKFNNIVINNDNIEVYNKIINICNKYIDSHFSFSSIKEAIIYDLKNSKVTNNNLENYVEIVPFNNNVFDHDEYVFLMNFNQGSAPVISKDEDFISDNLKEEVNLDLTNIKNTLTKESFIKNIRSINNLTVTYKLKSMKEEFYPSNLIKELNMQEEKGEINTTYSKDYSEIILGKMLDDLIKYDIKDHKLELYYHSLNIPYMKYSNKFTGITKESLLNKISSKLLLSYSTIDNYYRCAFRYYIANILKLDKYEETFKTFVGNLFHYLLSKCLDDDFDFNNEWETYIKTKELLVNEKFFLVKLKEELKLIMEEVKRLHKSTGLTDYMLEKKIYIDKSKNIPITFMGIVDKMMYKSIDGKDLIAIIDYKTGNPDTNLFNTIYGIDMQLPVYLYLVKYSNLFSNPTFVGFYLQKILHGEINRSNNKTYLEQKIDNLKLVGYSTTDEGNLARFDPTYENSEFIKSMKISSKGFYSYAKVIEDEKIEMLISLVNTKIDEAINDILNAKFDINPKRIGQKNVGCSFCKFKDICYMREEDIINLKEYKDFSFLGGDNNA